MREHSIFIEASFPAKYADLAKKADNFKTEFTELLSKAAHMADGHISSRVLASGEIVTDDTLKVEQMTQAFTGIFIDTAVTQFEKKLKPGPGDAQMESAVSALNNEAISLTKSLIDFKTMLLKEKKTCVIFTEQFYSELEHLRDEAQHYVSDLQSLQKKQNPNTKKEIIKEKVFGDDKMEDHADFIRHLLDPMHKSWFKKAHAFVAKFKKLESRADAAQDKGITLSRLLVLVQNEITATKSLSDFKDKIADAYQECKVQALFPPLWPDHVMREANHFLRELKEYKENH
jgi:hypothetical protein